MPTRVRPNDPAVPAFTIVALGDSITACGRDKGAEGWTDLLGRALAERFRSIRPVVINAGVGGNTSREGLARLNRDVLSHRPDIGLVEFGGNDATDEPDRHVPVSEFVANLESIRQALGASPKRADMVMLTFPPIVDERHGWGGKEKYRAAGGPDRFVEAYRQATRAFARRHGLALVDVDAVIRADVDANVLADGVHLTGTGIRAVADAVLPVLTERIERRLV